MRGVSATPGTEYEERVAEESQRTQPDESPCQVFRLQDSTVWDFYGCYGNLAQV